MHCNAAIKRSFLSVLIVLLFTQIPICDEVPYDNQEVIQKISKAWEEYALFLMHCGGNYSHHIKRYDCNGIITEEEINESEVICDYPCFVHAFRVDQNEWSISGFNKDYVFEITERKKDTYSVYSVNQWDKVPERFSWHYRDWEEGGYHLYNRVDSFISDTSASSLYIAGIPLPALFVLPEFEVTEMDSVQESGVDKIKISFTFSPETYSPIEPVRKGTVVLLPDFFWLPERMELYLTDKDQHDLGKATIVRVRSFEYQNDFAMPLLKKEFQETSEAGKLFWDSVTDYDLKYVKHGKYPKKRFTLSYYGLPEPDFGEKDYAPFRIFLFVSGLAFISVGFYQMRRKRSCCQNKAE